MPSGQSTSVASCAPHATYLVRVRVRVRVGVRVRVRVRVGVRVRVRVGVRVRVSNLVLGVQVLADEGARARGLRVAAVLDRVLEVGHLVRMATAEWSHGSSVPPC